MRVWVLHEEFGAYEQYMLHILGVFSAPDAAKRFLDEHLANVRSDHPSNWRHQVQEWRPNPDSDGDWIADSPADNTLNWSIVGFDVDRRAEDRLGHAWGCPYTAAVAGAGAEGGVEMGVCTCGRGA